MSVQIALIDLSAATVGTTGKITWSGINPPPTVRQQMQHNTASPTMGPAVVVFNESGCLLKMSFPLSGQSFTLPAGRWVPLNLPPQDNEVDYLVQGIAPGAPFTLLIADYYFPGEPIDPLGLLGNSPIGVSGQVQTSTAQAIKNDGNVLGTSIVEATPAGQGSSSWQENNDGSGFQQTLSSSNLRTVWSVTRGGSSPATIQFGDSVTPAISTFYGSLQGGQPANVGSITGAGSNSFDGGHFTTDGLGNINLNNINAGTINSSKIVNSTTFSSDAAKFTTDGSGNVTGVTYTTTNASTPSCYTAITQSGATGDQTQLDWIDQNSGGVRWNIGKLSHTHGGSPSVSDAIDFFDVTNNQSCLIILPNNGGLLDQNRNHFGTLASVGGGSAGRTIWDGTSDPTTNAGEGDIWAAA